MNSKNRQQQLSNQKLIQDLNFSTNIFFVCCSTLESICMIHQKNHQDYENKFFGAYDKSNYKQKGLQQLQAQLHTQIFGLNTSKMVFQHEHPKQWKLPSNFNGNDAEKFIGSCINFLKAQGDQNSAILAVDFLNLVKGHFTDLNFQKPMTNENYRPQQQQHFHQNLVNNSSRATHES